MSQSSFHSIKSLFDNYQVKKNQYVSREYQDYGLRLAHELNDVAHKSLYIKLAKNERRSLLERARSYVADANVRSKAKVFMWKLKQLKIKESKKIKIENKK
jgi:hypothetical protein